MVNDCVICCRYELELPAYKWYRYTGQTVNKPVNLEEMCSCLVVITRKFDDLLITFRLRVTGKVKPFLYDRIIFSFHYQSEKD